MSYIKKRVHVKLKGWKKEVLSSACRETLIKVVATSIPAYPVAVFKFPKKTCNEINGIIAKFWWGETYEERKVHWQKWEDLTQRKIQGGLGFRDIESFNQTLLAKL